MTPAKDRFEALVTRVAQYNKLGIAMIERADAVRLLKREHAAIVRAVKRLQNGSQRRRLTYERLDGYVMACEDVLALLAARTGKG